MILSFLNVFLPEDEYKRLRVLYFMAEAAFLMGGLLMLGSALNNYWLKWNLDSTEVTFILMMFPMLMVGYTYFRYIFSGIEHTEVSNKRGYKEERRVAGKRALLVGVLFFIIFVIVKGIPTNYYERIDMIALPIVFTLLYFLFDLVSLKRSAKKNNELED
ncbi:MULTISPECIES: hypothetical protein [Sporosarcina]|uniref:DUF3278 domain-containing protein n=1 Tax=Sporosarcina newyorkensis TaxID=759851 RepID=A0A1T4Y759_9BACL|nr:MULTISPECIES: hypothetical protein [Sporosarcina]MBY0221228.1 hypothetical protein [Sporosarcina aquimarina]SKA97556.1 hypothetical protein SAMN04244570_1895 [Sporosarcina newyorkensis]